MQTSENFKKKSSRASAKIENWSFEYRSQAFEIFKVLSKIANRFLLDTENALSAKGREYVQGRGIGLDEAREYEMGFLSTQMPLKTMIRLYADTAESKVLTHAYAAGILQRTQLLLSQAGELIPCYGDALVLPEFSLDGEVVNIFLRNIDPELAKGRKFTGLTGVSKKSTSYGLRYASDAIAHHKTAIIVEGALDALSLTRGVDPTLRIVVAPVGCQLFIELLEALIACGCERIVLAFDGDEAGTKGCALAVTKYWHFLNDRNVELGWLRWSNGKDPDDLLRFCNVEIREQILNGVIKGEAFSVSSTETDDGVLCRYIPRANHSSIVSETHIDLDIDQIQIPHTRDGKTRGRKDLGILRMRCMQNTAPASAYDGKGVTVPAAAFNRVMENNKFGMLAVFVVLMRALIKGKREVDFESIVKHTCLAELTVLRSLRSKALLPFFTIRIEVLNKKVFVEPSEELSRRNDNLFPASENEAVDCDDLDSPPVEVEWWSNSDA